jgi:hypothetical protein
VKKLLILAIVLVLVLVSFSVALAAPWDNPNGFWLEDVDCGELGTFDVWVQNSNTSASFDDAGKVGISKAIYVFNGEDYELIWKVPGKGVFKNTIWCTWELDGMQFGGDILSPHN